jgi:hypothetical protein
MSLHAPDLRRSCVLPATRYIFALLCLLNVNMGALDLSRMPGAAEGRSGGGGMDDDLDDTDGLEGCGNKAGLTPLFMKPKFGMEEFSVVHFAGPVKYGCTAVDKVHFLPRSRWERQGIANDAPTRDSPPSPPPHPCTPTHNHCHNGN